MADSELPKPSSLEKKNVSRRTILKGIAATGATIALSGTPLSAQAAQEQPQLDPKEIAISIKLPFIDQETAAEYAARIAGALKPLQTMIPPDYPQLSVALHKGVNISSHWGVAFGRPATEDKPAVHPEAFVLVFCPENQIKQNLENIEAAAFNSSTKVLDSSLQGGLSNAMALKFHTAFGTSPENYFEQDPHATRLFKFSTYSSGQRVHIGDDMETRQDYLANGLTLLKYKPEQVLQELNSSYIDNSTKERVASLIYLSLDVFSKRSHDMTAMLGINGLSIKALESFVKPDIAKTG